MIAVLLLLLAPATGDDVYLTSQAAESCVMAKVDRLERAKEAADLTVDAAITACISEFVAFRTATSDFLETSSPALSEKGKREVSQSSFELSRGAIRNRAILKIVERRASNAPNP